MTPNDDEFSNNQASLLCKRTKGARNAPLEPIRKMDTGTWAMQVPAFVLDLGELFVELASGVEALQGQGT
jgi:hypothetical protein